jgi:tetratricopeptide (TPR) repeat protein
MCLLALETLEYLNPVNKLFPVLPLLVVAVCVAQVVGVSGAVALSQGAAPGATGMPATTGPLVPALDAAAPGEQVPANPADAQSAPSLYEEGCRLLQDGNVDGCIEKVEAALALSEKPEYLHTLGVALLQKGRLTASEKALRRATDLQPRNPVFWRSLGRVLYDMGKHDEAMSALNYAAEGQGANRFSWRPLASPASVLSGPGGSGGYPQPGRFAGESLSSRESFARTGEQGREFTSKPQQVPEVISPLSTASRGFPGRGDEADWVKATAFYNEGNTLRKAAQYDEAIIKYRAAIGLYPFDADFYHNLGLALKKKGDLASAEMAYRKALELSPGDWDTWYNLGSVLYDLHRFAEARQAFLTALKYHPPDPGHSGIDWYMDQLQTGAK